MKLSLKLAAALTVLASLVPVTVLGAINTPSGVTYGQEATSVTSRAAQTILLLEDDVVITLKKPVSQRVTEKPTVRCHREQLETETWRGVTVCSGSSWSSNSLLAR